MSIQYFDVKRRLFQKFDIYDYIGATFWNLIVTFSDALQFAFIIFVLGLPDVKNMKDCVDWKREGFTTDGVYSITPAVATQIEVYCDMTTDVGGWLVSTIHCSSYITYDIYNIQSNLT